jgi:hypothetical protein
MLIVEHCITEAIMELIETCFWEKSIGRGRRCVNENFNRDVEMHIKLFSPGTKAQGRVYAKKCKVAGEM